MGGNQDGNEMTDNVCIAALLSGMLGSMGMGGGSVLIIFLTLFANTRQKEAQGINLIFFIPCAIVSVIMNLKNNLVRPRTALYLILGGIFGITMGLFIFSHIESGMLGKIFGFFIIFMGVYTLFSKSGERVDA